MARVVSTGVFSPKLVVSNPGLEPGRQPGTEPGIPDGPEPARLDDDGIAALRTPKSVRKLAFGIKEPERDGVKARDSSGLYLWLMPNGSRLWRLRYRVGDKQREYAIGAWGRGEGELTIDAARAEAAKARAIVAEGLDPVKARQLVLGEQEAERARSLAEQAAKLVTFAKLAEEWFDEKKNGWSPAHRLAQRSRLDREILPAIGSALIGTVDTVRVLAMLQGIKRRGAHEVLAKCRIMVSQIFRFAIAHRKATQDPVEATRGAFVKPPVKGRATIELSDFPELFKALAAVPAEPVTKLAFFWVCATACRSSEMRFATWNEIGQQEVMQKAKAEGRRENVRVKVPVWRVPASRMKMDTLWLQPLSPLAVAILERARELRTSDAPDALIFPGFSRNGALSENALLSLLARGGFYGRQTTHGMRASFASWAHPIGFDGLAVELCLAHRPGGVLGTYNRSEYILERLEILTAWADELTALGLVLP